jgi:hypothetical protein
MPAPDTSGRRRRLGGCCRRRWEGKLSRASCGQPLHEWVYPN